LRGGGGTNIVDALWSAVNYLRLSAPDRRRVVILISDNQQTIRGLVSVNNLLRTAFEAETVIYSIKTPGESMPISLSRILLTPINVKKVVSQTGGEVIDVERESFLEAALGSVIELLRTRYSLGYHPTNKSKDGSFRNIEIRLTDRFGRLNKDYLIFARRGYYARPVKSREAENRPPQK